MIELDKPVVRKSRLNVAAARERKVVVSLEATDTVSIRQIGTRKENAYSVTFERLFWILARARAEAKADTKRKERLAKRKANRWIQAKRSAKQRKARR